MRIGLIAMSGIRVCDPDLLALGLTLPGVVERGEVIASLPSLGLLTLAGMLDRDRHEVSYHEVQDFDPDAELPGDFDLVAISSLTPQIRQAYALADSFRKTGAAVVLGGLHATCLPEEARPHVDAVVVGEGEIHWPQVVRDTESGQLQGQYVDAKASFDMAQSPLPAYDLLQVDKYNRLTVQTSRGCPLKCEFCASSILLTSKYKQKPIELVLRDIDAIKAIWRRPFIEFADDNSFCNRRYWRELLPELAKRKVRWFTESDISIGTDSELLKMMRQAGCFEVLIGLESPDESGLAGVELKSDWKRRRWHQYRECVQNIQAHGIAVNGCFVLGLDNHDTGIFDAVAKAAEEMELFDVQITVQTPFPGTPLYDRLKRDQRLIDAEAWEKCTLFDVNFVPARMTPDELTGGFHQLVSELYAAEAIAHRRERFREKYYIPM